MIQQELEDQTSKTEQLEDVFQEIDVGAAGYLDLADFQRLVADPRIIAYFRTMGLEISTAYHLFRLLDLDNSDTVSVSEFVLGCLRLQGTAKNVDVATLMYENKRMMIKWVTFMDFMEGKFEEVLGEIARVRVDAQVFAQEARQSRDKEKDLRKAGIGDTETLENQEPLSPETGRRSWREKTLGQRSSLNIYDNMDPAHSPQLMKYESTHPVAECIFPVSQ